MKFSIITLGCKVNAYESQYYAGQLEELGYEQVSPEQPCDICIINTCTVTNTAASKSRQKIHYAKRMNPNALCVVVGCFVQFANEEERKALDADLVIGAKQKNELVKLIQQALNEHEKIDVVNEVTQFKDFEAMPVHCFESMHRAFLKVQDGCNQFCSYCAIPIITGRHVSRPMEEILQEVRYLVDRGVKEFQIIAQELTYYGVDLYHKQMLPELVERIADIPGVEWIRLHYAYPAHFPTDLFRVMRERPNVCKYMDIALQHISDNMLQKMRRHVTKEQTYQLIENFRKEVPGIHLRTTLMVGHPGETEADFEELKEFVRKVRFDRMGAFAYSEEEGTFAANNYEDNISQEVKQARLDELMAIQQEISSELSAAKIGRQMKVIIDRVEGDYYIGRTEFDSPEVDPEVLIERNGKQLIIGNFYQVEIVNSDDFDLYGRII